MTTTRDLITDDHIATIERGYEAFAAMDLEAVLDMLHPDIVVRQSDQVPWGGEWHGKDGFTEFVTALLTHLDTSVTVEEVYSAGHSVVQIGRTHGTVRANDAPYDHREIHVWQFLDGKPISMDVHIDVPAMLRALGA